MGMETPLHITCCRTTRYNCWICRVPFYSSLKLRDHVVQMHILLECTCCQYSADTDQYYSLKQHARDKHNKSNLLHCPRCHYISRYRADLLNHYQEAHTSVGTAYYCTLCGYSSADLQTIDKHLRSKHLTKVMFCCGGTMGPLLGENPIEICKYNCSFCCYSSKQRSSLLQHFYDTHWLGDACFNNNIKYYYDECSICEQRFNFPRYNDNLNKYVMNKHLVKQHNTSVEGTFCKRLFKH